jgi:hypothetical protein
LKPCVASQEPTEGVSMIIREQLPQALARADHVINVLPASASSTCFISSLSLLQ